MAKNLLIAVLLAVVLVLAITLVRVENQRYAMSLGMCAAADAAKLPDMNCLRQTTTRTGWWWHLYYAVTD